jgi:hypothetical protein
MKIVDLQSENKRKAYQTPLLKSLGEVKELTKSEKGSDGSEIAPATGFAYDEPAG